MAKKTVLITGATGLLGRQVVRAFSYYAADSDEWIVKGTGFSRTATAAADGKPVQQIIKLDLADAGQVEALLDREKPRVVVHCAANRFPDKVDKDPEGTKALNVEASRRLARLCAQRGILLIYISTDYVFSGKPGEAPYEADAETGPTNLYGQTKLDGEKAVLGEFEAAGGKGGFGVVLRVPILYGSAERTDESAVNVLLESVRKAAEGGSKIKMDHWALRYPTNTEDVGRVCHDVAVHYLSALDAGKQAELPKMLQFSSEDKYTKYEICRLFAEILGLPIDGIEANTEGNDPNASVQRPYDCHLSTRALKEVGIDVSTQDFEGWWRRELRAFRK
ncbi:methionine adenosyltransferase 2 subunit beta [Rhypophila decipiens]|uniref:Methionine adenosyltransferase 2 subunit beta n=1 Tax=Rhypophila decipiens TaxID=261697 RepID=A0AAN7B6H8_9PEZI|nr:methionine adenosyltransferase 2 subunit beta [Rhypophila decipiens]